MHMEMLLVTIFSTSSRCAGDAETPFSAAYLAILALFSGKITSYTCVVCVCVVVCVCGWDLDYMLMNNRQGRKDITPLSNKEASSRR